LLLVLVDTFAGWVEALPCSSEKAWEVIRVLIIEIIPRFGLSWTLQSDNGPVFLAKVTQGFGNQISSPNPQARLSMAMDFSRDT
jgi:hypothetical protein